MLSLLFSAASGFAGPVSRVQRTQAPMMLAAPSATADVAYAAELKLAAESVHNAELERPPRLRAVRDVRRLHLLHAGHVAAFNEAIRQ